MAELQRVAMACSLVGSKKLSRSVSWRSETITRCWRCARSKSLVWWRARAYASAALPVMSWKPGGDVQLDRPAVGPGKSVVLHRDLYIDHRPAECVNDVRKPAKLTET